MGEDRKSVEPGDVIAEKYRVERVIGRGGMGVVVAAAHVELGHRVALKFLLPNALENAEALSRFEREARASVALKSDHVSRVLDVGRLPDGAPYIVMELLDGRDLAYELHHRGGRLPVHEAVTYIVQACDALAEAHAAGIVHRDLKPSNLFLAKRPKRDPIVKVLDFGISKATSLTESPSALTATSALIGSPLYMSPEQLKSPKSVDARSDVWSLGATLYELIAGKPPFGGETMAELSANILTQAAPDVRTELPGAPPGLADVLRASLAKNPEERFASVEEFADALAPFTKDMPSPGESAPSPVFAPPRAQYTLPLLPAPKPPPAPPPNPKAVSEAAVSFPPPSPARGSALPVVIGAGALFVGAAAITLWATKHADPKPPPAPIVASASPPAIVPATSVSVLASAEPPASASASASAAIAVRSPPRPSPPLRSSASASAPASASASALPSAAPPAKPFDPLKDINR